MKIIGFTPVFDNLVVKYKGIATALVYGKIWRYCEWSDLSICTTSNNRLAEELGIGESTVRRAKDVLEKDGFIRKTGRDGTTDTVTVLHNLVLELYGPGDSPANDKQPSANGERATPLKSSDKDRSKIEIKDILAWSGSSLQDYPPDVIPLLEAFITKFKRNPSEQEKAYWIKVARKWKDIGVKPGMVGAMYDLVKNDVGNIKSPDSITYAYDAIRQGQGELDDWEVV